MRRTEIEGAGKRKKLNEILGRAKKLVAGIEQLDEGRKFIKANNREEIGIDQPHVPGQQVHAHLPNGRAVNKDGSISHGGKPFELKKDWADALCRIEFDIPKSRLIESDGDTTTVEINGPMLEFLVELQAFLRRPKG